MEKETKHSILISEISELLAIIHGDGGQYHANVGTVQAIKDAKELLFTKWQSPDHVASLQSEIDRLKEQKNDLIEAVESISHLLYDARNIQLVKDLYSLITRIK